MGLSSYLLKSAWLEESLSENYDYQAFQLIPAGSVLSMPDFHDCYCCDIKIFIFGYFRKVVLAKQGMGSDV